MIWELLRIDRGGKAGYPLFPPTPMAQDALRVFFEHLPSERNPQADAGDGPLRLDAGLRRRLGSARGGTVDAVAKRAGTLIGLDRSR